MGCGCSKSVAAPGVSTTFQVVYRDGQVRNYMTAAEADAAVQSSANTANPATRTS